MAEIPVEVADTETIVRAVFHPYHLNRENLKWQAFLPPSERRDVSVVRHDYLGTENCRRHAKAMQSERKRYRGFASLKVHAVRTAGPDVIDSREEFLGHADIMHKHPAPPAGEPSTSQLFDELRETCKRLAQTAKFCADPDPDAETWSGEIIDQSP
jgi:hypothetical protein